MSILSLIFAYIISDEFISRNLKDKENIREKEKIIHVEREIKSIETGIVSDMEIYSKSKVVQEFYENINQNISIEDKRKRSRHKVKNADYIAFKIGDRYRVIKCNKDSPEELGMFFSLHQFEKIQIINLKNK